MILSDGVSAPALLYVAVADTKYISGINDINDAAPRLRYEPIETAFLTQWPTDAHFVCYHPVNTDSSFPRLNKPVLPKMRLRGADIHTQILAFDFDNPGHVAWDPALTAQFWAAFQAAAIRQPLLNQFALLYFTKAGARFVFLLDQPIPVDIAEGKHRWMVKEFGDAGLPMDKLSDWTRLFRMPYVVRDDKRTWDNLPYYAPQWHMRIEAAKLPSLEVIAADQYGAMRQFNEAKPSRDDALELLEGVDRITNRRKQTAFMKAAKIRLKGRESFGPLFEHLPLAAPGARDTTLHKLVGQVTTLLMPIAGTTPSHIYALFLESVEQLERDHDTPDWTDKLWDHVGRIWVREESKVREEQALQADQAENALELIDQIAYGMRLWCPHPALHSTDPVVFRDFALKHMIVSAAGKYFVMRHDGWYDDLQLQPSEVGPKVRALGLDSLVQIRQITDTGFKSTPLQHLLDCHATIVSSIEGQPCLRGGYIRLIDDSAAVLTIPIFNRNQYLTPEWDDDVDQWLQVLGGSRSVEICEWIAWALAFEEGPICALSIKGDAGVGKKLLTQGLAECLLSPALAGPEDLVSGNQYNLLKSPFIVVDEGWPQTTGKGRHPADEFRRLVGGQGFDCNRKYMAPVKVQNPVRVVFTANNINVIQMLTANRDLSPEDREALRIRLKHIDVGGRAAAWLRQKGGLAFTGRRGQRWIQGDGGEASDYRVAKHFLWLYENREKPVNSNGSARLLIEGDAAPELMFEMRTQSGSTPVVIEAIIKLLNMTQRRDGICVQDHRLFVLASEILEYQRAHMAGVGRERLTSNIVGQVLKNLILHDYGPITLRDRPHLSKRRWSEVDPSLLLAFARRDGWSCKALEQLVEERGLRGLAPAET